MISAFEESEDRTQDAALFLLLFLFGIRRAEIDKAGGVGVVRSAEETSEQAEYVSGEDEEYYEEYDEDEEYYEDTDAEYVEDTEYEEADEDTEVSGAEESDDTDGQTEE